MGSAHCGTAFEAAAGRHEGHRKKPRAFRVGIPLPRTNLTEATLLFELPNPELNWPKQLHKESLHTGETQQVRLLTRGKSQQLQDRLNHFCRKWPGAPLSPDDFC